jgi:ADP-ribosylglycohydrolase
MPDPTHLDRIRGCLLGGAIGDALGAPVEFLTWREIKRRFGPEGIRSFAPAYGGTGHITDDTQMTLFTAEGLIRAQHRRAERGGADVPAVLHRAYLRWLFTQVRDSGEVPWDAEVGEDITGWLLDQKFLHSRRAPGTTCMGALLSGSMGTPENPINDSKGCGGVMRVAPVGLVSSETPFDMGCRAAAITHGHPSGWIVAGAFAQIISAILDGWSIPDAVQSSISSCQSVAGGGEVVHSLSTALQMVEEGATPTPERIESLGGGWVGEEALAISVYCVLSTEEPAEALALAVNHSGDSDSTGSITGNLLGAVLGVEWLDAELLGELEGRAVIERVTNDLYYMFDERPNAAIEWDLYPPW